MITTPGSLQDLRRSLYIKAKTEPTWRFWGLYVHVCKEETLQEAYKAAKENDGAPGIDGVTFEAIEAGGADGFLQQLRDELIHNTYRPIRVRKKAIPKEGSNKVRILSIPAIRDRVVQGALKLILEPIFEADFKSGSYGYRPKRTAHEAVNRVAEAIVKEKTRVIDLDLRAYLDPASYCPLIHDVNSNSVGLLSNTLIRRPLRRPRVTSTASSSPRFTRCNTVWRETPSFSVVSSIGRYPGGVCSTKRARNSSVIRICHGAPGVTCSPAIKPSLSHR